MAHTKMAISIPQDMFEQIRQCADAEGTTRSAIVVEALRSHFDRKSAAEIIARLNEVYSGPWTEDELREEESLARARRSAARRISAMLRETEDEPWQRPS